MSAPENRIRKGAKEGSNWNDKNLVKAARLSGDSRERREENNNSPAFNSTANQDNKARGKKERFRRQKSSRPNAGHCGRDVEKPARSKKGS